MFFFNFIILFWHSLVLLLLLNMAYFSLHPIFLCLSLVIFSGVMGVLINKLISQWLMVSILLIFLGGMMVIFLYCSFLANEDKMEISVPNLKWKMFIIIFWSMAFLSEDFSKSNFWEVSLLSQSINSQMIMFLLFYLLLSLMLALMFTKSFKGSMNKFDF